MQIRQADGDDVPALIELRRRWTGLDDDGFAARWRAWYERERDRRVFFLAEQDGAPIGTTNLLVFERMPRPGAPGGGWGYLANMFVVEEARDNGVGSALLAAVIEHAAALELERIVLRPTTRSVPFYRRAGFAPAAELLLLEL